MVPFRHIVGALILIAPFVVPVESVAKGEDLQVMLAKARDNARHGRTNEAIAIYRLAVLQSPLDAGVRAGLARLLSCRTETRVEAEKIFAEAVELAPNDVLLAVERADNLLALGDIVNAALEYKRAFQVDPENQDALDGYVHQIVYLGALPVAIERFREELATKPSDPTTHLMIAALLQSEARYNDALDHYLMAMRAGPGNQTALRGAARSWLELGYNKRAEEMFIQAAAKVSKSVALIDRARLLMAEDQPDLAISLINANLSEVSSDPSVLLVLADAYRTLNQTTKEKELLTKIVAARATDVPVSKTTIGAMERLARVRLELNNKDGARSTCEELLNLVPGNEICRFGLELARNQIQPQTVTVADATLTPTRRAGRDQRAGEAAMFWNQPARALTHFRRALEVRADSLQLILTFGDILLRTGDAEGATKAFAQVVVSDGNRPDAIIGMAEAELLRGRLQQALTLYTDALRLSHENIRALKGQSETLVRLGKPERAATILSRLTRLAPGSSNISTRFRDALNAFGRTYRDAASTTKTSSSSGFGNSTGTSSIEPTLIAGDKVLVRIANHPELNAEVRLDMEAMLHLPFLDSAVDGSCLTERELGARIAKTGGQNLAGRSVEVVITEYQLPSLKVGGAVYLPGEFNIRKGLGLMQALMLASGTKPSAGRLIYVVRDGDCCNCQPGSIESKVERYDRTAIESGQMTLSQPLHAGDTVLVTEAQTAFITGAVSRPGIVATRTGLTLLDALQSRGGTLPTARRDKVTLHRLLPSGISHITFNINIDNIEQGQVGKVILLPGDVVEIQSTSGVDRSQTLAALVRQSARGERAPSKEPGSSTIATSNNAP